VNRFKQIDILRTIAVLLVLGRHLKPCPPETSLVLHELTDLWSQGGWIGVDLFFVLSGFLVSGLLFREYEKFSTVDLKRFLIRRGFKIYPPFWLLIAVTVLVRLRLHSGLSWRAVTSELLFVQNYGTPLWNHTWSLAVEEHFYFLLAAGVFALVKVKGRASNPFKAIPAAFFVVALLCLGLRLLVSSQAPFVNETHAFPSHLRLDALFFGVLISYFFYRHPRKFIAAAQRFRRLLCYAGVLLLLPPFLLPQEITPFIYTYGMTLCYLGSGCLLVAALGLPSPKSSLANAIAYAGSHSYSVYLWHIPVAVWGADFAARLVPQQHSWFMYFLIYTLGTFVFGIAMARMVEFPVLSIRDLLFPSLATPLTPNRIEDDNALTTDYSAAHSVVPSK
jgi:peptidoglycan/LPS O-acetylase OafA/YrhL